MKGFTSFMKYLCTYLVLFFLQIGLSYAQNIQEYKSKSVLSDGDWYKISVKETGIYKITGSDLTSMGIQLSSLKTAHVAIYGNKSGMIPEDNSVVWNSDLQESAIYIKDINGNGVFEENDYILFYAESPNVWEYDQSANKFNYQINHYASENCYYLSISKNNSTPKRIEVVSQNYASITHEVNSFIDHFAHEKEMINPLSSGRQWLGEKIDGKGVSIPFSVSNIKIGSSVDYSVVIASDGGTCTMNINNENVTSKIINNTKTKYSLGTITDSWTAKKNTLNFNLLFALNNGKEIAHLKRIMFTAWRDLKLVDGQMNFRNTDVIGDNNITKFNITKTNNNTKIWDVTDPQNIFEIKCTDNQQTISFVAKTDTLKEYILFDNTIFLTPNFEGKVKNQNLHELPFTEYVIVTHPKFITEAERLAEIHRLYSDLHVTVVTTTEVYNEFSSGKQDPLAIRRFAKMFYDRYESLSDAEKESALKIRYLLLFGDGTYDNKNIKGSNFNYVVTYQSLNSNNENYSDVEDQAFGILGSEEINIGVGRFTASSLSEAAIFVDKVEGYILRKDLLEGGYKDWRNYIGLVTDDFDDDETYFVSHAEFLADEIQEIHPEINAEKIYADSYKQYVSSGGQRYPDANNAIKKRMNDGALAINYIGHGSFDHLGQEHYFPQSDIPTYTNKYALPLIVTSTCEFGMFDRLEDKCGAEEFVLNPNGGAIAVVSAARKVVPSQTFNAMIITSALEMQDGKQNSIGDALRLAKNTYPGADVESANLLGDPALKLSLPTNKVRITKINSSQVIYTDSTMSVVQDTMKALSEVSMEGLIVNKENQKMTSFNGKLFIVIFDKPDSCKTLANDIIGTEMPFVQQKNKIYQGQVNVENGEFSVSFFVPLCIKYDYDFGKISLYAKNSTEDATGYYDKITIGGVNEDFSLTKNDARPSINLFMNDTTFRSGGMTDKNPTLIAVLADEYGINYSGGCVGKNIEAWLDGNTQEIYSLNDFYEQDEHVAGKGIVRYAFKGLSQGKHTLTLRASNVFNLTEETSIDFIVDSVESFKTGNIYNYPNPFAESTTFVCEINNQEQVKSVEIQVFDMQGKLLKTLKPAIHNDAYSIVCTWDGRTDRGGRLKDGVYIYRYVINTESGKKKVENRKFIIFSR